MVMPRKEEGGLTRTWLRAKKIRRGNGHARMAELADAPDSKSGSRKRVGVRPSLWAPCDSADRIVRELQSDNTCISSVDMFKMVAYSSRSRVMKTLNIRYVGPIFISVLSVISLRTLNLTEEAAHA